MRRSAAGVIWRLHNVPLPEMHLLAIGVALAIEFRRNGRIVTPSHGYRVAAMSVVAAGLGLIVWAVATWERLDIARPVRVVTSGPYSISRHPMYLGWHLIYIGLVLFTGSRWLVGLFAPLLIATHLEMRREEQQLASEFELEYARYRRRTGRYISWPGWRD
jgi:protein-S-isoprenylcysteine O-methyltransferase Ste14